MLSDYYNGDDYNLYVLYCITLICNWTFCIDCWVTSCLEALEMFGGGFCGFETIKEELRNCRDRIVSGKLYCSVSIFFAPL